MSDYIDQMATEAEAEFHVKLRNIMIRAVEDKALTASYLFDMCENFEIKYVQRNSEHKFRPIKKLTRLQMFYDLSNAKDHRLENYYYLISDNYDFDIFLGNILLDREWDVARWVLKFKSYEIEENEETVETEILFADDDHWPEDAEYMKHVNFTEDEIKIIIDIVGYESARSSLIRKFPNIELMNPLTLDKPRP